MPRRVCSGMVPAVHVEARCDIAIAPVRPHGARSATLPAWKRVAVRRGKQRDRRTRFYMKYVAAVLAGSCMCLSSAAAIAATPQEGTRASMLSIILVAGVMIVAVKLAIAFAKRKMEADIKAAQEKPGSDRSRP
ncbi:hypothetical protein Tchl_1054 [Thauera chlorobenzoica]|uniref:Uncharacterized protein n=2 Tax=Thauera chlorobenzoica TaxID=96773 RepID=A0A1L6FAN6_9RHOO|nr:hypothetical protein Tchl_1054 [Thauera chlorobenzoica]